MKLKPSFILILLAAVIVVLGSVFYASRPPVKKSASSAVLPDVARAASPPPVSGATVAAQTASAPEILAVEKSADVSPAPKKSAAKPAPKTAANAKPKQPKPEIKDPGAREALSLVGVDPAAEQYWISAINDDTLPADERRELIEDLNQDGFVDRKNPGLEDFQLIVSRIQLIEELAPSAKDQVNSIAFAEAYKDLVNMLSR